MITQELAAREIQGRFIEKRLLQSPQEEERSARDDRRAAARDDPGEPCARIACKLSRAVAFARINEIQAVVGYGSALRSRCLRGPDVEATIHLSRIHRDDLAID